jgi:hypothetical protein
VATIWESVTATGSRADGGPRGVTVQVNEHQIVDDVAILARQKLDARAVIVRRRFGRGSSAAPRSGLRRPFWPIAPVTASCNDKTNASAPTPAGTLKVSPSASASP